MGPILFRCSGSALTLPTAGLTLVDRDDGGNLCVVPPREVWDRSELLPVELARWSFLVAAAGTAMLKELPQLAGGCINYWDAGNWALHEEASPPGPKSGERHRRVHLHLLGRSRSAADPSWAWGEAPRFPPFRDRLTWASGFARLTAAECRAVVRRLAALLVERYGFEPAKLAPWVSCSACGYPSAQAAGATGGAGRCEDCAP